MSVASRAFISRSIVASLPDNRTPDDQNVVGMTYDVKVRVVPHAKKITFFGYFSGMTVVEAVRAILSLFLKLFFRALFLLPTEMSFSPHGRGGSTIVSPLSCLVVTVKRISLLFFLSCANVCLYLDCFHFHMKYWFNGMFVLNLVWKARRKEKDAVAISQEESKLYLEQAVLECSVQESRLREVIDLPPGIDYNEWLASHTIAFFDHTNLVYGTISEFCTMSGCPDMNGPNGRQYLWFDEKGKKCKVAAPQYIDCVMTFTQRTLYDESIFPTKFDRDFPSSFESIVKKIQRLLFHVLAHIYHIHFKEIVLLNMHAHLNTLFAHFTLFNERFNVVDEKETEILQDLAVALKLSGENTKCDPESNDKSKVTATTMTDAATPAVIEDDNASDCIKDCSNVSTNNETSKRPPTFSQSTQSIASSISMALHSRSSSGSHSSSGSCAMDSALYSNGTPPAPNFGSSPLKFQ